VLAHDRPGQRLVNATEGGARVAGFEELTLRQVLSGLPERNITPQSLAEAAAKERPPLTAAELLAWTERQLLGARRARHAARRVRRLAKSAEEAVSKDDPRAITRAFAKLDEAEQSLRVAVGSSPFVDAYSWSAVDLAVRQAGDEADSRHSAAGATQAEARMALAIETCTRELELKLEQLLRTFGASAP